MDITLTLLVAFGAALAASALRLLRTPFRQAWDWWLVLALALAITGVVGARAGELAGVVAGAAAFILLVLIPWWLTRRAWLLLARGEIAAAQTRATWVRALHPLGSTQMLHGLLHLAARLESGEEPDIEAGLAALGVRAGQERSLTAMSLAAWGGDFARASAWLHDPVLKRAAIRRGNASLALASAGETGGPEAIVEAWQEIAAENRIPAGSQQAAGLILVAAAYLGAVDLCREISRELSSELPAARLAFWLATAEQRAGDVPTAHETLAAAVRAAGATSGARARLERRMMHPLAPVPSPLPPAAAELLATLRQRVEARRALAGLRITTRRPSPVTISLAAVLGVVFAVQLAMGMGADANETLYRLGGLPVPLPSSVASLRLLTYGLLHAGAMHLALNALTLWFFGRFVEQRLGGARMLVLYVLAGVAGGVAALLGSAPGTLVVGASGSIFGLVGAAVGQIVSDRTLRQTPEGRSELLLLAALVAVQAAGDAVTPHVSSMAHVGGLLCGLLGGLIVRNARRGAA